MSDHTCSMCGNQLPDDYLDEICEDCIAEMDEEEEDE